MELRFSMGLVTPLLYSSVGSYYHVWNRPLVVSLLRSFSVFFMRRVPWVVLTSLVVPPMPRC